MRIGVLGSTYRGNHGEAAIYEALRLAIERHSPGATVVPLPVSPADIPVDEGDRASGGFRMSRVARSIRAAHLLRQLDVLVVTGGIRFSDDRGGRRGHPYAVLAWSVIGRLVGTPVAYLSVGVGPLESRFHRRAAQAALSLASFRSYRDLPSKGCVTPLSISRRSDPVYPDLAFGLPALAADGRSPASGDRHPGVAIVAFSRRGRTHPGLDAEAYGRYLRSAADAGAVLVLRGYTITVLAGDGEADGSAADELEHALHNRLPLPLRDRVSVRKPSSFQDLRVSLACADYVIASRFHSALAAHLLGKPTLVLAHQQKVRRLMRDAGVAEYCLDIDRAGARDIVAAFDALVQNANDVLQRQETYAAACRELLERQYRTVFQSVVRRPVEDRRDRKVRA